MITTLDAAGNVPAPLTAHEQDVLAAPGALSSRFRWDAPIARMEQCGLWGGAQ